MDLVLLAMGFLGPARNGMLEQLGVALDQRGNVATDHNSMTSVPGIFACGDVVWYPSKEKRIVTGCGEAATAVMSAYKFLRAPYWA